MKPITVVVTGSSGLVGSALVAYLAARGYVVRALQRSVPMRTVPNVTSVPFHLADVHDEGFEGADVVVHCAYRSVISRAERMHGPNDDVLGAEKILALSRKYGLRVIFLSSLSAHEDAISYYGQNKLRVEHLFDPARDAIVRLGIVLGGTSGLFGKLLTSIQRFPLIPLLDGGHQIVQTIALGDACRVLEHIIQTHAVGIYDVAHPRVVSMRELSVAIARAVGVHRIFVPVPSQLIYWCARVLELLTIPTPFTPQNVLGLQDLRTSSQARTAELFGIRLQDYQESLESELAFHARRH